MSPEISERSFEEAIECGLLRYGPDACVEDVTAVHEAEPPYGDTPPSGYRKRKPEDYDRGRCLLPRDVVDFVLATQPSEWKKLAQHHGDAVRAQFLKRVAAEIERRGTLDVLRNASRIRAASFASRISGPRAGSTKRRGDCTRRTCSPSYVSSVTAKRTATASIWCCS